MPRTQKGLSEKNCRQCGGNSALTMFNNHAAPTGWGYVLGQGNVGRIRRSIWGVLMLCGIFYSSYMIYDNAVR